MGALSRQQGLGSVRFPSRRFDLRVTSVLLVLATAVASRSSADAVFPIADWRGVGWPDALAGGLLGGLGGSWVWEEGRSRLAGPARLIAALAAASALAAVPPQVHQSLQLTAHYARLSTTNAVRSGAYQVPSVRGQTEVFDRLRGAIGPKNTYVLYADWPFVLWAHTWLLPRLDVDDARHADWAIFHYRNPAKSGIELTHVEKIAPGTWLGRIAK